MFLAPIYNKYQNICLEIMSSEMLNLQNSLGKLSKFCAKNNFLERLLAEHWKAWAKKCFFRYLKTDKSKIGSEISEIISEIIIFFSKTFLIESKKV